MKTSQETLTVTDWWAILNSFTDVAVQVLTLKELRSKVKSCIAHIGASMYLKKILLLLWRQQGQTEVMQSHWTIITSKDKCVSFGLKESSRSKLNNFPAPVFQADELCTFQWVSAWGSENQLS